MRGGLALFVVQVLAAPMVHLAHHRADHTHGPNGELVPHPHAFAAASSNRISARAQLLLAAAQIAAEHARAHAAGAAHVDGLAVRWNAGARARSLQDDPSGPSPDPSHGRGAAAHFGLALLGLAATTFPPPHVALDALAVADVTDAFRPCPVVRANAARAPPPRG